MDVVQIPLSVPSYRSEVENFLQKAGLRFDDSLEYYAAIYDGGKIIAGGGFSDATIKCIAADPDYRGDGLINTVISHLRSEMAAMGKGNIFLFTKPKNREIFESLAFYPVGETGEAMLLESSRRGVKSLEKSLENERKPGLSGAVVMNCNPFTRGHRYLVEEAASRCDNLFVFPVKADLSAFPYEDRLEMIKEGTADIKNVTVLSGGDYIISSATFPTYFLKNLSAASMTHAMLDADIFARHIAPPLGIKIRFLGSEPIDKMTAGYNSALSEVLPKNGIKVEIIKRLEIGGRPVSASRVREALLEGRPEDIRELVPETTYKYLLSEKGKAAAGRIKWKKL